MQTVNRASIEAMYNRFGQLMLTCAALNNAPRLSFAQGGFNALRSILESKIAARAAKSDASVGGYQPLAGFEAAWAALPVGAERFTLTQMQEFLGANGVDISSYAVSNSQFDAVKQFKDGAVCAVNGNDEHSAARADLDDGSGLHGFTPLVCATVAQGGAA